MNKVIIAGSRYFDNYDLLKSKCDKILSQLDDIEIVSGRTKGPDRLGEDYAKENNYPIKYFPANWNKYKKAAGHIRNKEMACYADYLIIFWDGESRGSKNMIEEAENNNLKIRIIYYNPQNNTSE